MRINACDLPSEIDVSPMIIEYSLRSECFAPAVCMTPLRKMMRKLFVNILLLMTAMLSLACVGEESPEPPQKPTGPIDPVGEKVSMSFSATLDDLTKTILVDGEELWWKPGDRIRINGDEFVSTLKEPASCSEFVGKTMPAEVYHAVSSNLHIEWNGKDYIFALPSQTAIKNTLPVSLFAAECSDSDSALHFCNLLGYIKFTLPDESRKLSQVEVWAKGAEAMSDWSAVVDFSSDRPVLVLNEPAPDVYPFPYLYLNFESAKMAGDYYIALYPGTYSNGLKFSFKSQDGKVAVRDIAQKVVIESGTITDLGTMSDSWWKDSDEQMALEREALIDLYNATDGDNWHNNAGWCSDKPLGEWNGVITDDAGTVSWIYLNENNLTGTIPETIGNLKHLQSLNLDFNSLEGELPNSIGNMINLTQFSAINNNLTGNIPESIGDMVNLEYLNLDGNALTGELPSSIGNLTMLKEFVIPGNNLTGSIPESVSGMTSLENFFIFSNFFTGTVPRRIMEMESWPTSWHDVLEQRGEGFSSEGLIIPAPRFTEKTIDGETIDDSIYSKNEYTILYHYNDWCHWAHDFTPVLVELYKGYRNKGLAVIAYSYDGTIESHRAYAEMHNTEWPYLMLSEDFYNGRYWVSPGVCVVDKDGYIIFNYCTDDYNDLDDFLLEKLGEPDPTDPSDTPKLYESTDYSRDGEVKQLQVATKGNGIDIVLMGDAFSDRLIADGTYDRIMQTAMEKIFEEEPYKSFRDHFNVYSVTAVSKNEVYSQYSETAFDCYFGELTIVGGDNDAAFSYAAKAIGEDHMDQTLVIVMMNSVENAGTCYMYVSTEGDWSNGASVSYFPVGSDDEELGRTIRHEAGGHGFAKLSDEYAYYENGHIPDEEVEAYRSMEPYGWGRNIDFTSDPAKVKWSHFLTDSRYDGEGLGVIEGACTFWTGAYRPTEYSIMRYNWGGFNAPSREAIYYRIHKLAYGPDWEYDYEKFVEYDAINRKSAPEDAGMQKRRMNYVEKSFEPTAPPVIIKESWRDAVR